MNNAGEIFLYEKAVKSNPEINIWLAFPAIYNFGLSSLGFMSIFKTLDLRPDYYVERIFTDTKSTDLSINQVDLMGFSFSFDTDFLTIFSMLEKYGIPLKGKDRQDTHPIIFAGGPVITTNPAPYEDFFDFFVIGDGENVNLDIIKAYKDNKNLSKNDFLKLISDFEGVYVPSVSTGKVKKLTKKLDECIYTPILSKNAFFPNTFIMEVARGCANRCGFCIASYLNLPLRFMPYEDIIKTIDFGLSHTNKIALLGAQLSAHPHFDKICNYIYEKIKHGQHIEMSVSSLRVDAITPEGTAFRQHE